MDEMWEQLKKLVGGMKDGIPPAVCCDTCEARRNGEINGYQNVLDLMGEMEEKMRNDVAKSLANGTAERYVDARTANESNFNGAEYHSCTCNCADCNAFWAGGYSDVEA